MENSFAEITKPSRFIIGFLVVVMLAFTVSMTVLAWLLSSKSLVCSCVCIVVMGIIISIVVCSVKALEDRYLVRSYEYQRHIVELKKAEYKFSEVLLNCLSAHGKIISVSEKPTVSVLLTIEITREHE